MRQRRSINYGALIGDNENVYLSIDFSNQVQIPINFVVYWIDPDGYIFNRTNWHVPKFNKPDAVLGELVLDAMTLTPGVERFKHGSWKMNLVVEYNDGQQLKETLALVYNFLILPTTSVSLEEEDRMEETLFKYWHLQDICMEESSTGSGEKHCRTQSKWSSLFPDPKAEISSENLINENRILI